MFRKSESPLSASVPLLKDYAEMGTDSHQYSTQ